MSLRRYFFVLVPAILLACGGDTSFPPSVGTLERDRVDLVAETDDPILEIAVREGDLVSVGDLLVRLDPARLAAGVAQAEAFRNEAAARLAETVRGPRSERITEARARLAGARSAAVTAERELERVQALAAVDVTSRSRLDEMRTRRDSARAQRDEARAALGAMLEGSTVEELDRAQNALAAADAALMGARIGLQRLEVRAPTAGRIDALPYEAGERPRPGATVAVLLVGNAPYARVHVPEAVRVHLALHARARIEVEGLNGSFAGRLRRISHDAVFTPYFALTEHDRGRLSYLAEVELTEERARELPNGVPVEVYFEFAETETDETNRVAD